MIIDAKYKSLFIFPAAAVLLVLFVTGLFNALFSDTSQTAWLGAAVAATPLLILLGQLMLRPAPRTSENLPLLMFIAAAGVMVAAWEQFLEGTSGWGPTGVALSGALLFLMYVFWYSRFGRFDSARLMVGSKLPDFSSQTIDGETFDSTSLLGAPAVLLFFRGNWCPLCLAQIREIAERYQDMAALGIRVVLISPQPEELSRQLAARFDVPFTYLVDTDSQVAESLGIAVKNGVPVGMPGGYAPDTVLPTLIVCNETGTILFSDQTDNYRVRPEPDVFLAILRRAGVVAK